METLFLPLVNGMTWAMMVFLVASGLSLVFGVLKILNFAHGGFFMLGVYLTYTFIRNHALSPLKFFLIVFLCGIILAIIGAILERLIIRRFYQLDEAYMLIATYALLLVIEGCVEGIWGLQFLALPSPKGLGGGTEIFNTIIPSYSLVIIASGVAVAVLLNLLINRSPAGKIIRAAAGDPDMTSALGINVPIIYTMIFAFGIFLAAIGGGIGAPNQAITPTMASSFIIQAFGVVVVGGLGNIGGAFLAAIILGLVDSFGTIYLPQIPGIAFYAAMALILLVKPHGLFESSISTK